MYSAQYCCSYGNTKSYGASYGSNSSGSTNYFSSEYHNSSIDLLVDSQPHALTISDAKISEAYTKNLYLSNSKHDYFTIEPFLTHLQETEFVDDAKLVEEPCKTAFRLTTGKELPSNISIRLCSQDELKKAHIENGGIWSSGIQGFSINRGAKKVSEVFVKKDSIDRVMITLGHEIGHVISKTLPDTRDEEAKAFAFSIAWMRVIIDNNIAGLSNA